MDIHMAAFVFGCLLLFVAILGGGFEIKELKVPTVGRASRLSSSLFGALFIAIGFSPAFAGVLPGLTEEPKPQTMTSLAQTTAVATPDLRPATEPARKPRVSKPAPRPSTPEPGKPSWRKKAQRLWHRVW
jgi:hypothetical protein